MPRGDPFYTRGAKMTNILNFLGKLLSFLTVLIPFVNKKPQKKKQYLSPGCRYVNEDGDMITVLDYRKMVDYGRVYITMEMDCDDPVIRQKEEIDEHVWEKI